MFKKQQQQQFCNLELRMNLCYWEKISFFGVTAFLLATAKKCKKQNVKKMHPKVDTKIGYFFEANDGPIFITKTWLQQNKNKPKMSQKCHGIFFSFY